MRLGMRKNWKWSLPLFSVLFISLSLLPSAAVAVLTPGTGVTWTMVDVVANSAGQVVAAPGGYLVTTGDINIAAGDTLTLSAGETVTFGDAGQIGVYGSLNVVGTEAEPVVLTKAALPEWNGIRVYDDGQLNFDHGRIERADYAVYFSGTNATAPASAITNAEVNEAGTAFHANNCYADIAISDATMDDVASGIVIENYYGSSVEIDTVTGTNISSSGLYFDGYYGSGLSVSNVNMTGMGAGGYGLGFYELSRYPASIDTVVMTGFATGLNLQYGGGQLTVSNSTFQQSSGDGIVIEYGFGDTIFSGCSSVDNADAGISIAPNSDYAAGDGSTISGCSFLRNGAEGIKAEKVAAVNLIGNTIEENTAAGLDLDFFVGGLVRGNTIQNNGDGIVTANSHRTYKAAETDYQWIEVNASNADDWLDSVDDDYLSEAEIGFAFPLAGADYSHFQMESNALIELETASGETDDISDYEGWAYVVDYNGDQTFIFARTDDWDEDSGPINEDHGGASVQVNGFGYKHFAAGDTDGDGTVVAEECMVMTWYTIHIDEPDVTPPNYNAFQVVIYPDGRIKWNTRFYDATIGEYSPIQGAYVNKADERLFIYASGMDPNQGSYLYDPQNLEEMHTRYYANDILSNGGYGVYGESPLADLFIGNTIESNADGVVFGAFAADPAEVTFTYNSIADNTNYNATSHATVSVDMKNNYWALTEAAGIDATIDDDEESGSLAAVFEPFLLEVPEIDCQAEAGPDQDVIEEDTVTLAGSNSAGAEAGVMAYLWAQESGASVTLSSTSVAAPTFDAPQVDAAGDTLVFQLTTTDIFGETTSDTVSIEVGDTPIPVTADAGADQDVVEGDTVNLQASNADGDDSAIATVAWTQVGGTTVALTDATRADASFVAPHVDADGEILTFQVSIVDIYANTTTDTVDINVSESAATNPTASSSGGSSSCFIGSLIN